MIAVARQGKLEHTLQHGVPVYLPQGKDMKYPHKIALCYALDITVRSQVRKWGFSEHRKHELSKFVPHILNEANKSLEGYYEMANKQRASRNYDANGIKFCTILLDTEQKSVLKEWLNNNQADLDTYFHNMVTDGWKTSCTWDDVNDCFIASATQRFDDDKNYNVCVSSRSDNLYEAILITYYKIYVLYEGKRLPTEPTKANWG